MTYFFFVVDWCCICRCFHTSYRIPSGGDKERGAFKALKAAFTKAPVLQYPDQDHEFQLETDAFKFAISGVLSIKGDDGDFRPVTYMSHLMTPPECNYPIHNKEMLAIIKATEYWRHYLKPHLMLSRFTQITTT